MNLIESVKSQVGNVSAPSGIFQAAIIVVLVFLLLLVMARMTRSYISWYTSGWYIWVVLGFLLAVVIEGLFVVSGSTIFTSVLGWKNAPKPIQSLVDNGRAKLIDVLGVEDTEPSKESVISDFSTLDSSSSEEVKSAICEPKE